MIIDQLPLLSGDAQTTDEFPIERGTTTYKVTLDRLLAALPKDATPTEDSTNAVESGGVYDALQTVDAEIATKQDTLTFDSAPTQGSSNPVTSGGVYTAIENATPDGFVSYAEAQTLTSAQKKQARDNIGAASEWARLWTNTSPNNDFSPQSVAISGMGSWSEFRIQLADYKSRTAPNFQLTIAGYGVAEQWCFNAATFHYREVATTANGVTFEKAATFNTYGSSSQTENNSYLIPWYVEGRVV